MTNADRIRAMTYEELAEFCRRVASCPDTVPCDSDPNWGGSCRDCWKNWMQAEVSDDQ